MIVCGLLSMEIQLYASQKGRIEVPLITTWVCLFHEKTWISKVIWCGLFCGEGLLCVLLFGVRCAVQYVDISGFFFMC